mmetsp:Transcript_30791/g.57715  ORF Transcript_30791/g.57715 Transcript_30791/m.57715 type:complete len:231 (+) Transcript_30791:83-775(+)
MPLSSADALDTLGLTVGCNGQDVTRAFRRLARQHHPDKGGDKEKFQKLNAAYELLSTSLPVAPPASSATKAPERPPGQSDRFQRMWAEVQRNAAEERAARKAAAARAAAQTNAERKQEESRRRKRLREEEERRCKEEWESLRQEQAQLHAANAQRFAQRRAKWSAQHRAHVSGVSYDMQAEALQVLRWLRRLQQSRLPRQSSQASGTAEAQAEEPPPKMARVLRRGRGSD